MLVNRAPGAEPQQIGRDLHHVEGRAEGHVAQLLEADPVDRLALGHEFLIALDIARRDAADFLAHDCGSPEQLITLPSSKRMS